MIKFQNYLLVSILLTASILNAQDYKFGEVSKEELEEKFSRIDSSAAAEYLYKYRKTNFEYNAGVGFKLVTRVHERIKIYNKDGFDYATKKVVLFKNSSSKEELSKLKAKTYNLQGGEIVEVSLKKEGEFKVELSDYRSQESFTMPNIKEGSVIEYKYEVTSPFISNVDEFVFQHGIPIRKLEATLDSPEYFVFRVNTKGFFNVVPKTERVNRTLNYQQRVADGGGNGPLKGLGSTKVQRGSQQYFSNISKYEMQNVPALKDEPYVNELNNYRAGVKYELSYTQFPDTPRESYATSWEAVVKAIYDSSRFGNELKRTSYFEDDVDAIISGVNEPQEKMLKIFDLVKSKVKWNEFYGKYTRDGVRKAYKEGVGNVAEINLMLTAMLSYAGLNSNPVLVSTRSNGIPLFPTREGYNYVVSSVEFPEGTVLLDATSAYSSPSVLPFRTLNWNGRIIKNDGTSKTIGLYPENKSTTRIFLNANLSPTGSIQGKLRKSLSNHKAMSFRNSFNTASEDEFIRNLEEENGKIEISNLDVKNNNDLSKSAVLSYEYSMDNDIDVISDRIYFSPLLFLTTTENPFRLEQRDFPVDFGYPSGMSIASSITIPDGYQVENLPKSLSIALPEEMGSFKFMLINKGSLLQLKVSTEMNLAIVPVQHYLNLKEFYKKMIEKMNEKVVLSKI